MPVPIVTVDNVSLGGLNVLVYGETGAGKTRFAATAAEHEQLRDVLFVDIDKGMKTVAHQPHILRANINSTADVLDVWKQVENPESEYRKNVGTYVIDSVSAWKEDDLSEIAVREAKRQDLKKLRTVDERQLQDYKEMTARLSRLISNFRKSDKTLLVLAGEMELGRTEERPPEIIRPDITNALWKQLRHMVDAIWYIKQTDGKVKLLTQSFTSQSGTTVVAKTRNERFAKILRENSDSPDMGVLTIGNVHNLDEKYPSFATIYDWYLQATTKDEE